MPDHGGELQPDVPASRARAERATIEEVLPVRLALLRPPGFPPQRPKPEDLLPECAHFVVRDGGRIVATATINPEGLRGVWQLRAVAAERRGRGEGRAVVEACIAHARERGATRVWCHGRTGARGFYERLGFRAVGEEYEVPVSGPHFRMELPLRALE